MGSQATSLQVITVRFPNPEFSDAPTTFDRVNSTISRYYLTTFTLRTLSSTGVDGASDLSGLLYVPDLPSNDPCIDASKPYVPQNVTRQANLPDVDFDLIALAPWLSPNCVLKYLDAARHDPVRAFMFYLPDNSTHEPPDEDDSRWNTGDGNKWKRQTHFPVYAIPGASGNTLMTYSSEYSGNMTDVYMGSELDKTFDSREYVRLYAEIDTSGGNTLPSLWVFLLVVLGILLAIIGATSLMMHLLQRRRRQALRRRVASGEVDLEALGIKRLTVPQEILDKMPLYTYGSGAPVSPPSVARETTASTAEPLAAIKSESPSSSRPSSPPDTAQPTPAIIRSSSYRPTALQQPTCAICLDDFVPASDGTEGTIVRELPCHHIFHPECVDTFLRDSSSLCPMCKKTALPKGYCPRVVTNAMVRRERMVRRIRPSASDQDEDVESSAPPMSSRVPTWSSLRASGLGFGRRVASMPVSSNRADQSEQPMTEMSQSPSAANVTRSNTVSASRRIRSSTVGERYAPPSSGPSRREWARQRAVAMLGRRAPLDPDAEEAERTPRWRKALRTVFPAAGRAR